MPSGTGPRFVMPTSDCLSNPTLPWWRCERGMDTRTADSLLALGKQSRFNRLPLHLMVRRLSSHALEE